MFKKKVHIVPMGFEIDRIIKPFLTTSADTVYLITNKEVIEGSTKDGKRGQHCLREVKTVLATKIRDIQVIDIGTVNEFFDLYSMMAEICYLLRKEKEVEGNEVYINVSAGSCISSIASTLVCLMYGGEAYYLRPDGYSEKWGKDCAFYENGRCIYSEDISDDKKYFPISTGMKDFIWLPYFPIEPPEDDLITVLQIIQDFPAGTTQEAIIRALIEKDFGDIKDKKELEQGKIVSDRLRSKFRRKYFNQMDGGLIENVGSNRQPLWTITEEGRKYLKIFGRATEYVRTNKPIK